MKGIRTSLCATGPGGLGMRRAGLLLCVAGIRDLLLVLPRIGLWVRGMKWWGQGRGSVGDTLVAELGHRRQAALSPGRLLDRRRGRWHVLVWAAPLLDLVEGAGVVGSRRGDGPQIGG